MFELIQKLSQQDSENFQKFFLYEMNRLVWESSMVGPTSSELMREEAAERQEKALAEGEEVLTPEEFEKMNDLVDRLCTQIAQVKAESGFTTVHRETLFQNLAEVFQLRAFAMLAKSTALKELQKNSTFPVPDHVVSVIVSAVVNLVVGQFRDSAVLIANQR